MVVFDNIAHILRSLLLSTDPDQNYNEWKVLGEEFNGRIIVGWVVEEVPESGIDTKTQTCIGSFSPKTNQLKVLLKCHGRINVIQATATKDYSILSYVVRTDDSYSHFVVPVRNDPVEPISLGIQRDCQIMTAFLDSLKTIRLLVMIHTECISLYHLQIDDNGLISTIRSDSMTKSFTWAQWDWSTQSLYFIHFRKAIAFEEDVEKPEVSPTLSCLQFHPDLPHETVLNIPLNLPSLTQESQSPALYEDDCIPLRVHDCALDLLVVSDKSGIVCICHHYLYQPVKPPGNDNSPTDDTMTVHFAYSVTLLHHGCVIHCALPGVRWLDAKTLRPGFTLLGSQYLLIHGPGVFTHLLDIGLAHEPFCHMLLPGDLPSVPNQARLVTLSGEFAEAITGPNEALTPVIMLDLLTLDLLEVDISYQDLINGFQTIPSDLNRLAIFHYFLVHANDLDLVEELLSILSLTPHDISVTTFFQEVLVGGSYSIAQRSLPSDASHLVSLLPMTCIPPSAKTDIKVDHKTVSLNQEILWNTAMMLLSPQQRLVPYRADIWTKLWDQLAKLSETPRFKHSQVTEKLLVSLACYQPEVLSRCSTPMSPAAGFVPTCAIIDVSGLSQSNRKTASYELPFLEVDSCTASKQEHIISVNTRELNMYLMKNSIRQAPMHVHAVAARYVTAQLDMSKQLCHLISRVTGVIERPEKGFCLIKNLDHSTGSLLFTLLQRFHHAAERLAFPLPQGLSSFFCYLGYTVLPYQLFLQYLNSNVLQLQVDVMKEILKDTEDDKEGAERKVRLLQALPRSRAKRLLNTWTHPVSLMLRAREHALNILSGVQVARSSRHAQVRRHVHASRGLAAFPSGDRVSPLDTFLDLLTAKANLTELDFTLLIEATVASTEEFL